MQAKLIINGEDFSPWLRENGLQQTEIVRQGRSVVALDGTEYRGEVRKRGISASLVEVRDTTWQRLQTALRARPALVAYVDDSAGPAQGLFYVSGLTASAETVRGGHTYFSGGAFTLEER